MTVYAVMILVDDEYLGRDIHAIYAHEEDARAFVTANQETIEYWDGETTLYTIEEYTLQ